MSEKKIISETNVCESNVTKRNKKKFIFFVKLKFHIRNFIFSLFQIVVIVDAVTCIICGICVFSTMGNLALEQGKSVDDVIADGPGLVFVVFPHALAKMPIPQLWSATFFFMLILLGIDSQVNIPT